MNYAYTILYVADVEESAAFYSAAFGFARGITTPEGDYAELKSGAVTIAFASLELGASNFKDGFITSDSSAKPFGMELAFTSDNLESDFEKALKAGAQLVSPVTEKPWGQKVGYVRDLNGFLIELCTPMNG